MQRHNSFSPCPRCGGPVPDYSTHCQRSGCGHQLRMPPPPIHTGHDPLRAVRLPTEPCAIASLILGVLGLVFFGCIGLALSLCGLILGYVGLSRIDAGHSEGRPLAWAGIGLSGLALIVAVLAIMALGAFLTSFSAPS